MVSIRVIYVRLFTYIQVDLFIFHYRCVSSTTPPYVHSHVHYLTLLQVTYIILLATLFSKLDKTCIILELQPHTVDKLKMIKQNCTKFERILFATFKVFFSS